MRLSIISSALMLAASVAAATVSNDGSCAGTKGFTCTGSTFGNCCSEHSYCGSTSGYCGLGCQTGFGTCGTSTLPVSKDATCGGANGFTCQDSTFGNCCSKNGYCGSSAAYCGTGCQAGFGTCSAPPTTGKVSPDATCGGAKGYTCKGSAFGDCCSANGYCGDTDSYCRNGCQSGFGTCNTGPYPSCDYLSDNRFTYITTFNTTNFSQGNWTFSGSAEVVDQTIPGEYGIDHLVYLPGTPATFSQNAIGLVPGAKGDLSFQLQYGFHVDSAPGGTGSCTLTHTLGGTQLTTFTFNQDQNSAPGTINSHTLLTVDFTPTATTEELVISFSCTKPLNVLYEFADIYENGVACEFGK